MANAPLRYSLLSLVIVLATVSGTSADDASPDHLEVNDQPDPHFAATLPKSSACQGAIQHYGREGLPPVVHPFDTQGKESPLVFLGAGQGTTGTRSIAEVLCRYNISTIHWTKSCHLDEVTEEKHRTLMQSWLCLQYGTCPFYFQKVDRWKDLLRLRIREQLYDLLLYGNMQALLDTPYPFLVPEILAVVPKAYVLLTVRDPREWVKRRVLAHLTETVCRDGHHHPLDMYYCADADEVGNRGMMRIWQLKSHEYDKLVYDYAEYNARVRDMVDPKRLREICIWDDGMEGIETFLQGMGFSSLPKEELPDYPLPRYIRLLSPEIKDLNQRTQRLTQTVKRDKRRRQAAARAQQRKEAEARRAAANSTKPGMKSLLSRIFGIGQL